MHVLGLNISGYLSSAALVRDDEVLGAACEERYSRHKRDRAFPERSARDALARAGLTPADLDAAAVAWNPARNLTRGLNLFYEANASRGKYLAYVPNQLAIGLGLHPTEITEQNVLGARVAYVDHHLAHAASTCFTAPFDEGAFVIIDAFGEEDSLTLGVFAGSHIDIRERVRFPHSLGAFYSAFTELLGFQSDADEYKVMALGAYADPAQGERALEKVRALHHLDVSGERLRYALDLNRFEHYIFHRARDLTLLGEAVGVPPRAPGDEIGPQHFALAYGLQRSFEETVLAVLGHVRRVTGKDALAVAGGCFMNSVANGLLEGPDAAFRHVHIPPYPDDSGTAVGAALFAAHQDRPRTARHLRHNFFGPDVGDAAAAVARRKLASAPVDDAPATVARLVAQGSIVAVAAGGMEFGQRALGHRSIFADPRNPAARDVVNQHVKRREWFRPYAASILAEHVHEVFEAEPGWEALFMEKVRPVRAAWRERVPGILHADGSVRLHTVDRATNPRLHAILTAFHALTGVPLLLNTSFNVAGMPIVCSADDALDCFLGSGIDALVVGDRLLTKGTVLGTEPPA